MRVVQSVLGDVLILEPVAFEDERGFFLESYSRRAFREATGIDPEFVQDNHSRSKGNVLRGMHYQIEQPQGKLIRTVRGAIWCAVIDLRRSSATFKQWTGFAVSEANRHLAWVPPGFAHGFLVTEGPADVTYKTTTFYAPRHERTIRWDSAGIAWPLRQEPILSSRDSAAQRLEAASCYSV